MKKKEISFPTIVGIMVALAGLVSGLWLVQSQIKRGVSASAEETPKNVRVSNITDSSFSISWVTDKSTTGYIQYAEAAQEPDLVISDDRDQEKGSIEKYFTHMVTLKGLKPSTNYGFKVGAEKNLFDLQGEPYTVITGPEINDVPAADVAYGKATYTSGDPAEGALVYAQIPGGTLQSTLVKTSGSWAIPISAVRKPDLREYLKYNLKGEKIEIEVEAGPVGNTILKTTTENDSPTTTIIVGQIATPPDAAETTNTPAVPTESKLGASDKIILLTPVEGTKNGSLGISVTGLAPAGTQIAIEVHSPTVVRGSVIADESGAFSYAIPANLTPGEHTISIWAMVNGAKQQVTRSFVVYAAEETPQFTATPSATWAPTPTAKIVLVSPIPSPSVVIIPTAYPIQEIPATTSSLPKSGGEELTWIIISLGVGLVLVGGGWWWGEASHKV